MSTLEQWLRGQFDLADSWGWQEPEHIHFLLVQSLRVSDYAPPTTWLPLPHEAPATHFDRVYQEALYWQEDAPV